VRSLSTAGLLIVHAMVSHVHAMISDVYAATSDSVLLYAAFLSLQFVTEEV
jgi:hypothetical protein